VNWLRGTWAIPTWSPSFPVTKTRNSAVCWR